MMQSNVFNGDFIENVVTPTREMGAYEALWCEPRASFKTLADKFRAAQNALPSQLVPPERIERYRELVSQIVEQYRVDQFGIRVNGIQEYPAKLRDARNPVEVFYYQGWWDLVFSPSVAVVGSRKVSEDGIRRTRKLVKHLVEDDYTIVSGMAEGVDTVAHTTALELNGRTIAILGTPLSHVYPKQNHELQKAIREHHLLISQVPFKHYEDQDYRVNRKFFPERNITMSALTMATVIVEASDTSGTLYQARAALAQGRKLFILESCFHNSAISWPEKFAQKGAIRVQSYEDIKQHLDGLQAH